MKIALYIEDGLEQIVLTPESETEKGIVGKLHDGTRDLSIKSGQFYDCNGGWKRQADTYDYHYSSFDRRRNTDNSTMIVLRPKPPEPEAPFEPQVTTGMSENGLG